MRSKVPVPSTATRSRQPPAPSERSPGRDRRRPQRVSRQAQFRGRSRRGVPSGVAGMRKARQRALVDAGERREVRRPGRGGNIHRHRPRRQRGADERADPGALEDPVLDAAEALRLRKKAGIGRLQMGELDQRVHRVDRQTRPLEQRHLAEFSRERLGFRDAAAVGVDDERAQRTAAFVEQEPRSRRGWRSPRRGSRRRGGGDSFGDGRAQTRPQVVWMEARQSAIFVQDGRLDASIIAIEPGFQRRRADVDSQQRHDASSVQPMSIRS